MGNFGTVSDASAGTGGSFGTSVAKCGIWSGTCKRAEAHVHVFVLSPSFACEMFARGSCKTMVFYGILQP